MKRPIQAGDICVVVGGYKGKDSPNLGLIVEVIHRVYECPQLGILWRCSAEFVERARDDRALVPGGIADFAQSWLKKIEPPEPAPTGVVVAETLKVDA